jgi:hypothetical protein
MRPGHPRQEDREKLEVDVYDWGATMLLFWFSSNIIT